MARSSVHMCRRRACCTFAMWHSGLRSRGYTTRPPRLLYAANWPKTRSSTACRRRREAWSQSEADMSSILAAAQPLGVGPEKAAEIAAKVEAFVRQVVIPYERDARRDHHGAPTDELVTEMRGKARKAGVLTPHILPGGKHLS